MSDPDRLLVHGSDLEARLLAAAVDEAPPEELLARTLDAVAMGGAGAAATGGVVVAAKAGGIGVLGAVGIGGLAGLLTFGALELAASRPMPPPPAPPPVVATATATATE